MYMGPRRGNDFATLLMRDPAFPGGVANLPNMRVLFDMYQPTRHNKMTSIERFLVRREYYVSPVQNKPYMATKRPILHTAVRRL